MKHFKPIISILLLAAIAVQSLAQLDPMQPLSNDESVRYGVLENGMTYYIKANQEPKERASFYIIQNVGALLEEDHQNGLAHFLEHMAFNGTKHFPDKGITNFLERHGVANGADINAYTSFNETVYNLSDVPVNKPGILDSSLLILHDWSNYLLLTEEEIDAERGVITEEWRARRNADFRMFTASLPYLFPGSKYTERNIIGDLEIIQNFDYQFIRDFYHEWYRTDLQAIAMAGDFDADEMEKKVKVLFSRIPAVDDATERPFFEIPDHEEPVFGLVTDSEADRTSLSLFFRHRKAETSQQTMMDIREDYIHSLFNNMMGMRIRELLQKGDPPFVSGGIYYGDFVRGYEVFSLEAENRITTEVTGSNTDYSMNFVPKMNSGELLDGYYSIIQNTYSAKPYYKRVRQCILNLGGLNRKQIKIDRYYIQAFFKSIFIIGIFNKGRAEYWKLFIWTLLNRPGLFPYAIMFTITGYHFRKVYGAFGN